MTSFIVLVVLFWKGAKQEDVACVRLRSVFCLLWLLKLLHGSYVVVLRLDEMFLSDNSRVFFTMIDCACHLEVVT